ncbi:MAG: zinc-ribbon domain-containing protein, partial [candidate division KSB1 bacterium]
MKCQSCGHEVAANSRFCSNCGAKTSAANENQCPACSAQLKPNAQFCSQCGATAGISAALDLQAAPSPTQSRPAPLLILLPLLGTVVLIGILFLLFYNPANPKPGEANGMPASAQAQAMPQGGADQFDMSSMAPVFKQIDSLKNAVAPNPKDVGSLAHLGALFDMAGKFEQAAVYYRDLLAVEPENVEARMNYAGALFNNNERDKALAELHEVLQHRPNYDFAMYNLG